MRSEHTTQPNKSNILAQVVVALLAGAAGPVEDGRTHDGALSGKDTCYIVAHFFDDAAEFMSHGRGIGRARDTMGLFWDQHRAMGELV